MQFNSVQSGSFLTGAKSINENVTDIYNTAIQTGFAADQVIMQANANDAVKQVAALRRQASMANAGIDAYATAKVQDMKAKLPGQLKDIWRPAVRMEGINRMAGSVAAGAYIMDESKKAQKEAAELKRYRDSMRSEMQAILEQGKETSQQETALYKQILSGMGVTFDAEGKPVIKTPPQSQPNNSESGSNKSSAVPKKPVEIHGSGILSPEQVKSLALNSGFTDAQSDIVVKIARGESSFNPKAHNPDASAEAITKASTKPF